jgi:CRISPR-associated protein Cas8b/Csh1 subtype I-B
MLQGDSIITQAMCNENMRSVGDEETYSTREARLQDFLSNHPMLDDAEARSVFLLGALVGRISAYQYREGVSQKLTEQYPPSSITRRAIPEVTQEVLDRNYTYGDKEDISRFNRRYTDRLTDSMLVNSPMEWDISESEAKWLYALGVAYGKRDTGEGIERPDDDAEETPTGAEDEGEGAGQPGITEY